MKPVIAFLAVTAASLLCATAHAASLDVTEATIANGTLTVKGTTKAPFQVVKLDGQFKTASDGKNDFTFSRKDYHPSSCVVTVSVGPDSAKGVVANCSSNFGADATGDINASVGAHSCGPLNLAIPGAKTGDVAVMATTKSLPSNVFFTIEGTASNGHVTGLLCNIGSTTKSISKFPVRVITFH